MLHRYRFAVLYVACFELVYLLYEWQLPGGPHNGNALALGLLLAALSLPTGILSGFIQEQMAVWLGYAASDTQAFLPRLIAWQSALVINVVIVALLTRRKEAPSAKSASGDTRDAA